MTWTPPEPAEKPPVPFRRKPMLLGLLCWLLALPILVINFFSHVGIGWIVIAMALMVAGLVIQARERRRVRNASRS